MFLLRNKNKLGRRKKGMNVKKGEGTEEKEMVSNSDNILKYAGQSAKYVQLQRAEIIEAIVSEAKINRIKDAVVKPATYMEVKIEPVLIRKPANNAINEYVVTDESCSQLKMDHIKIESTLDETCLSEKMEMSVGIYVQEENSVQVEKNIQEENVQEENNVQAEKNNKEQYYFLKIFKVKSEVQYIKCFFQIVTFQLVIIYLEVVFHLLIFKTMDEKFFFPVLFALPAGTFLAFITGLLRKKGNEIFTWVFSSILCLIYSIQLVYHDIFKAYLSLYSVRTVGTDVLEFSDQILTAILNNLFGIILLLLPLPVMGIMIKKVLNLKRKHLGWQATLVCGSVVLQVLAGIILPVYGKGAYSPYDLYHNTWVQEMGVEQLGLLTSTRFDVEQLLLKSDSNSLENGLVIQAASVEVIATSVSQQEPIIDVVQEDSIATSTVTLTPTPTPAPIDTSPNVLNIDFSLLAKNEINPDIKAMHEYFAASEPTNKNEYTGMFEGYNLIMLTAEGFSPYSVDKQVTPTLYRLIHEGFVFNNFYTPLWWASTIDGEYVACTSLIPKVGVTSFYESGSNSMPFALGTQFGKLGYSTQAYHDHTYTYYKRNISHPNMGYVYKGVGNGLEITKSWPESDLEMMEVTIPEYIDKQPFHTYYMTVSGHMNYTFMGNNMATKNKAAVADLPYSMEAKAYIACNVELDRALEKLIAELEAKGIADKTVIALSADHYPYGLEKDKIDELAGHVVEENFELYRNHFILWSASMEEPIVINKACSSLDIIPTLSNLFALPFDSRLFMGQDILSDSAPLVMFSNRSFINDKVIYNSMTKAVIKLTQEELPEDYIQTMNQIVNNKFLISKSILEEDYYSYIMSK